MISEELNFPFDKPQRDGVIREVAEGIFWLRMPLPFALDHINIWLLRDGDRWCQVDTDIDREESRDLWRQIDAQFLDGRPIGRLICTHFHPDHFGLAGWLCRRHGCALWFAEEEWHQVNRIYHDGDAEIVAVQNEFFSRFGLAQQWLDALSERGNAYRKRISPPPDKYHRIEDGAILEIDGCEWRVITTRGHSIEQSCLYCAEKELLISGDQILPRISPNVTLFASHAGSDPLDLFLTSFENFSDLPASTLVLPSHGAPFYGLHSRIAALKEHHQERVEVLLAGCQQPKTLQQVIEILFNRRMDVQQVMFAAGESMAHLEYLYHRGLVRRITENDGIIRHVAAGSED